MIHLIKEILDLHLNTEIIIKKDSSGYAISAKIQISDELEITTPCFVYENLDHLLEQMLPNIQYSLQRKLMETHSRTP